MRNKGEERRGGGRIPKLRISLSLVSVRSTSRVGPIHLQTKEKLGEKKIVISFDKAGEQTASSENGLG